MFSDASSVLIGEKEVESIRLGSTVLYEKPSSVTDVNISVIWDDAGYESERPSDLPYNLIINHDIDNTIDGVILESENWQHKIKGVPVNVDLGLQCRPTWKYQISQTTKNGYNFTVTVSYRTDLPPGPPPM